MQPRLTRSRTDTMLAGVCGGLAEYFRIDPVLTRLIFVLITLTSGLGLLIYPILWIIVPRAPVRTPQPQGNPAFPQFPPQDAIARPPARDYQPLYQEAPQGAARSTNPLPYAELPPEQYRFDPRTGRVLDPPGGGNTINLGREPEQPLAPPLAAIPQPLPAKHATPLRRISWFGITLIGMGLIFLADQLGIDTELVFPILMIGIGLFLLLRKP